MAENPPVVVHPWLDGSRRVAIRGRPVGRAFGTADLVEFLRIAGLDLDGVTLEDPELIEWRGGGPAYWGPPG
ncbi:hypothetical protein [Streptomyces sp. H27-D2]|uniref:hypothetical protein n=1 Tax=Streptomyces sp. H27-D2 TaxID=3046304 RepID=UPI002DBBDA54|nr:hypothetical protein [Streptomyces sp. H27-D2]MEC4018623.1 hypothetical protein [Streptomyces sp. H27-D2]